MTTDWSNFGEPEDTFVHYVREGQMQPEVADGRSGMKMRDKLVFREGNNKHRAVAVYIYIYIKSVQVQ